MSTPWRSCCSISAGSQLIARAARGLEEEVHQGVRVPVGRGFAGRVAATRAPVTLDHVGPDTVVNPILWRKGVHSMLGVPLIAGSTLVGVMHVGTLRRRLSATRRRPFCGWRRTGSRPP